MSVLMQDTLDGMERLFEMSRERGVGHQVTLLSTSGFRRKSTVDALPIASAAVSARMTELWEKFPNVRFFKDYFAKMDAFLSGNANGDLPTCRAGAQSFNIDHVGNVSPCIEKIDTPVGNVRGHSMATLHARLAERADEVGRCQSCWTACRGFQQAMGDGGTARGWIDLGTRMRTQ
jgi:MoaA/NifB/PqqE/SkfB family radical SAM enzyme